MRVLLIGGGGREHAIAHKLVQSKKVTKLYAAPGNGGIGSIAERVDIKATDIDALLKFALDNKIDFTVVGPDDPLALGVCDIFTNAGLKIFGPNKNAAIIEYSKAFSKGFMKKYEIPNAKYEVFSEHGEALRYVENGDFPAVIKADGLALGKGVYICKNLNEAASALGDLMVEKKFGASGSSVIIEEYMTGPEITVLAFCDGKMLIPMISSQDHKRAYDDDEGPNTGGMGAYAPCGLYTKDIANECEKKIFAPTVDGLIKEGRPFKGIIYFSLMLTENGPRVIEYNARFGDPEAQAVLPLLKTDLLEIMLACESGTLDEINIEWEDGFCASVVMASGGYPGNYETGFEITGLEKFIGREDIFIFHAGTELINNKFYTKGGRVLNVTAKAETLGAAIKKAYDAAGEIFFKDAHYRRDIGKSTLTASPRI